jgi:hypothetical protein
MLDKVKLQKLRILAKDVGYTIEIEEGYLCVNDNHGGYQLPYDDNGYNMVIKMLTQLKQSSLKKENEE